ncbi:hypothetical protein ACVWZV_004883 [Bradyrhizobium sp. GM5.1]
MTRSILVAAALIAAAVTQSQAASARDSVRAAPQLTWRPTASGLRQQARMPLRLTHSRLACPTRRPRTNSRQRRSRAGEVRQPGVANADGGLARDLALEAE